MTKPVDIESAELKLLSFAYSRYVILPFYFNSPACTAFKAIVAAIQGMHEEHGVRIFSRDTTYESWFSNFKVTSSCAGVALFSLKRKSVDSLNAPGPATVYNLLSIINRFSSKFWYKDSMLEEVLAKHGSCLADFRKMVDLLTAYSFDHLENIKNEDDGFIGEPFDPLKFFAIKAAYTQLSTVPFTFEAEHQKLKAEYDKNVGELFAKCMDMHNEVFESITTFAEA